MKSTLASRNAANAAEKKQRRDVGERERAHAQQRRVDRPGEGWRQAARRRTRPRPAAAAASEPSVRASAQPHSGALTRPSASAPTPPTSSAEPSEVGPLLPLVAALVQQAHAVGDRGEADREVDEEHEPPADLDEQAADAAGRPPRRGRRRRPRCRSPCGRSSGSNSGSSSASEVGSSNAAPAAWITRAPTSASTDGASPQSAEPSTKTREPAEERAPAPDAGRPGGRPGRAAPRTRSRRRSAPTRSTATLEPAKSRSISGNAMLTMKRSRLDHEDPDRDQSEHLPAACHATLRAVAFCNR